MAMKPFTDNFEDNSTDAGFQFTFFCEICNEGYKTEFIESKTYRKAGFLRGLGGLIFAGSSLIGSSIGYSVERGTDILSERFEGMSPEWHKEHEKAFELAQNEAKGHFHRCPECTKWVCENDWNEQEGLCTECAPRVNVKIAAAKAKKMVADIEEKAANSKVFTGEIESKQTFCPKCGKPAGEGKFCNNCGAPLGMIKCPGCGTGSPTGTRFCGECGIKLG
ncbi:MAG TPA: zinc ribbon domain-containing protein [Bacillota bacterium]|nr:zinc ribbon domain-containing protein [Bacillota bacterium]